MKISLIFAAVLALVVLSGCDTLMTRENLREQEQKKEVTTLQRTNADNTNRFSDIESDLRELHGRVEVVENRVGQSSQVDAKARKASEENSIEQQKKLAVLQEEVVKLQDQVTALATEMANMKTAAPAEKAEVHTEKNQFDIAEAYFDQKEWRKAILNYQKFRETHAKDKRLPLVIYKIGVCFQELNMKDEAKTFYDEVIAKYPASPEAKKAKIRSKKLK